ncbi:MAG: TIGR02281 family clan AA aspartic protease [Methylobacterium frigidaeris]
MPGAVGLAVLLLALAWAAATLAEGPVAGLAPDVLATACVAAALALAVLSGIAGRFRDGVGAGLQSLVLWLGLGLAGASLYHWRDEAREAGLRLLAEADPGEPVAATGAEIVFPRRADGGFTVKARVDGRDLRFAFDTGASTVVLTAESAAGLGLHPAPGAFTVAVHTANGRAAAAPVMLDAVAVGPIVARRVPALVTRPGTLAVNLLGMSFLERLASYEVRGSRLILRGRAG